MARPDDTTRITRGARRALADLGFEATPEFSPARGLRVDLAAISASGEIWIVEVKSGLEDFRADRKWTGYAEWCDRLLFAVDPTFPQEVLPETVGVLVVDAFDGALVRPAPSTPLPAARRKALLIKIARSAAQRLRLADDPEPAARR